MKWTNFWTSESRIRFTLFFFIWLLYLAYRTFFWYESLNDEYLQVILNTFADVGVVYMLYLFMGPLSRKLQSRRQVFFGVWFLLAIVGTNVLIKLHYLIHVVTGSYQGDFIALFNKNSFQVFDAYVVLFVGLGISTAFRWYHEWSQTFVRLKEMEKEKALTELEYLKSQINPHFVFNTLNSIYFLIDPENEQARGALHTFSQMLRYQLYDSSQERVPVEKEIEYLRNYITLQSLRLDEGYNIETEFGEQLEGFSIPPLFLIIPIENAFKHLSHHTTELNTVQIAAKREGDNFVFTCENSCSRSEKPVEVGGIGLKNLKRRLELMYDEGAYFKVDADEHRYLITINLPI